MSADELKTPLPIQEHTRHAERPKNTSDNRALPQSAPRMLLLNASPFRANVLVDLLNTPPPRLQKKGLQEKLRSPCDNPDFFKQLQGVAKPRPLHLLAARFQQPLPLLAASASLRSFCLARQLAPLLPLSGSCLFRQLLPASASLFSFCLLGSFRQLLLLLSASTVFDSFRPQLLPASSCNSFCLSRQICLSRSLCLPLLPLSTASASFVSFCFPQQLLPLLAAYAPSSALLPLATAPASLVSFCLSALFPASFSRQLMFDSEPPGSKRPRSERPQASSASSLRMAGGI